jgi:methionine-gamma-lyase
MGAFGVTAFGFADGINTAEQRKTAEAARAKGRVGLILVETPANPTNGLVDLAACAAIADELAKSQGYRPPVVVDNTMLGPMFQTPLKCGADISLCSLAKYVGGHSDLVGGSISGDANLVKQVLSWRSSIGTQLDPNSCWMLMRSLETLEIRMTRSNANARLVAEYLAGHPKIARVHYLGFLKEGDPHKTVFNRQCSAPVAPSVSSRRAIVLRNRFSAFTSVATGRNSGGWASLVRLVRPRPWIAASAFQPGSSR